MKQLRWRIVALVIWLLLFFNIERLDIDETSIVNIASFVYLLAAATATLFLLVPLHRWQMQVTALGVITAYIALKLLHQRPVFEDFYKYITITEIVSLATVIYLGWLVNQSLRDFEEAVEAISLPEGRSRLLDSNQFEQRMRAEIRRARRNQSSLCIAMLKLDPTTFEAALHQTIREVQSAMAKRYAQTRFGLSMSKSIRETDTLAQQAHDGSFLLLAPDTTAEQASQLIQRLSHQATEEMGLRFRSTIVSFPDSALTSEELLYKADERMQVEPQESETHVGEKPEQSFRKNDSDSRWRHAPSQDGHTKHGVPINGAMSGREANDGN